MVIQENRTKLPATCFARHPHDGSFIAIKNGESGYYATTVYDVDHCRLLNERLGVTPAQVSAMVFGSIFGWNVPGADPDSDINQSADPYKAR